MDVLLIGNDHVLEVTGLHDEISGNYLNAAAVTATVKSLNGINVAGQSWPVTLTYVASSNGNYRATLEDGLELVVGKYYIVDIDVDAGSDLIATWRKQVVAQYRTF